MASLTLARRLEFLVVCFVGAFWGVIVCVRIALSAYKYGRRLYVKKFREEPKCLNDIIHGEHKFVLIRKGEFDSKGLTIHYVTQGDKQKQLLVLLHGYPEIWYSWRHQIKEFSKDYWVVAVDQRGFGKSDKPDGVENYSLDNLTKDVRAVIHSLGRQSAILVGHDWGAIVCWATASRYPELVEKLIVMNVPHPEVLFAHAKRSLSQFLKSWYIMFYQLPWLPEFQMSLKDFAPLEAAFKTANENAITAEDIETVKYSFQGRNGLTGPINYYRAFLRCPFEFSQERLHMPVLIIWGTGDLFLNAAMASASCIYADNVTLNFLDGVSHWVQRDDPVGVNQRMRKFLSK